MAVGNKLEQIIKEKGLTQKEVAIKAGIRPQTINSIIKRDSARADIQILLKICQVLNIDISIFAEDAIEEFYQYNPNIKKDDKIILSSHENRVIMAYRNKPDMQPAVDKILDVKDDISVITPNEDKEEKYTRFVAARSKDGQSPMRIEKVNKEAHEELINAPETDMDF